LFLYTSPKNAILFGELGFYEITRTGKALLMENRREGIGEFVRSLDPAASHGLVGAIVANCNPFTNGHLYLVEQASARCDLLRLFILSEDKSRFSASDRMALVKAGVKHLKNVLVHPTGSYLVSSATFPDYFLKDKARSREVNTALDLTVFGERFAKPLGITKRFVGTEPFDPVTSAYNRQMKEILPNFGVEIVELPRKEIGGMPVSASRVRALLDRGDFAAIKPLVPETTFRFLEGVAAHDE
jgi:[citrate (pro-3S)-lyase] ligase